MSSQPPSQAVSAASKTVTERVSDFVQQHRQALFVGLGVTTVVAGGAGYYYYTTRRSGGAGGAGGLGGGEEEAGKKRKKHKKKKAGAGGKSSSSAAASGDENGKDATVDDELDPFKMQKKDIEALPQEKRNQIAQELKARGNKSYSSRRFTEAIALYSKAIECHEEAVFYSNRAACYTNLSDHEAVIRDCTDALRLDPSYVKALNRRASARENVGGEERLYEALCDFTAAAIIDGFTNEQTSSAVERVMKRLATEKAKRIMDTREPRLPSSTFIKAYFNAFRQRPPPYVPENPSQGDKTFLLAHEALNAHDYTHALTLFNECLIQGVSDVNVEAAALNMRATFSFIAGDAAKALADLDRATELNPKDVQSYVKKASVHMELGQPDAAFGDFDEAARQDANDPDIYYHRGQVYFITSSFDLAIEQYQKSVDLDPDFIFSHIQLGVAQYKTGQIETAVSTFKRCMKDFPSNGEVHNYYGEILLDQQKFQEAVERFDKAIELTAAAKPRNVLPMINKALALFQWNQNYAGAEKLCQEALQHDPQCDIGVATLAQLLLQQNKVNEAVKEFARSAELARTEPELVNALTYENATRAQIEFIKTYPQYSEKLGLGSVPPPS